MNVQSYFKKYDKGTYVSLTRYLEINYSKGKYYLVVLDEGQWVDYDEIPVSLVEELIRKYVK